MRHEPVGAGSLYPDDPIALRGTVRTAMGPPSAMTRARGVLVPAGAYEDCAAVAGAGFAGLEVPPVAVVIATTGRVRRAIASTGVFVLPGDEVPIAAHVAEALRNAALIPEDRSAFDDDAAIESQLPFLRAANPLVEVVPVLLGETSTPTCRRLGGAIADVVVEFGREVLIVGAASFPDIEGLGDRLDDAVRRFDLEAIAAAVAPPGGPAASVLQVVTEASRDVGARRVERLAGGSARGVHLALRFT